MSSPSTRRRRRGQHDSPPATPSPTPTPPPAEHTPERGATLNLQNPTELVRWLSSNAEGFKKSAADNREAARQKYVDATDHERHEKEAADKEMALLGQLEEIRKQIDELRKVREDHTQQKEMRTAEAKKYADQSKGFEAHAADIEASIPVIQLAVANGNGQSPPAAPGIDLDPKETAEIDGTIARIDALRAELPADQRDEGEL
ncbi:MAG: hypothetical protein JWO67_5624 [Streptosporangiaceae bacterium]|nr:hypothetical protein [Streptosporangiaceae bacterium]